MRETGRGLGRALRRVLRASALLIAFLELGPAMSAPPEVACRIEGKLPAGLSGSRSAICGEVRRAIGGRASAVLITFHRDTVSAQISAMVRGRMRTYPETTVAQSDRAIGMDTIATLANAVAAQLK